MKFDNIEQLVENTNENSDKINIESKKVRLSKTEFIKIEQYQESIQDFIHKNIETWISKGKTPQVDFNKQFINFSTPLTTFKINKEIEKYCELNEITFLRNKVYRINTFNVRCVWFYR